MSWFGKKTLELSSQTGAIQMHWDDCADEKFFQIYLKNTFCWAIKTPLDGPQEEEPTTPILLFPNN